MEKELSRLEYLFKKYIGNNCPEAERNEFLEMVANDDNRDLLKKMINDVVEQTVTGHEVDVSKANEIFSKIIKGSNLGEVVSIHSKKKYNFKWWAAAAVLIIMAGGSYLFFNHPVKQEASAKNIALSKPVTNDIAPGHSGAILTLSNGKTIILDSTGNGLITKQGSTDIVKANGQISYSDEDQPGGEILYNTMSTPKGRQFQLVLSDGSEVWLNAASSITYPTAFSGKERRVEITGEVYFEIKPLLSCAKERVPFTVVINSPSGEKREIQVLGTHFNVNAYYNESTVKTTLLEGSVKVTNDNRSVMIKPGEQAVLDKQMHKISVVNADVEEAVAWKNGFFSFKSATIETIMRRVERWYDVDVVYEGARPDGHYRGEVPMDVNASELLKVLEVSGIHFRIDGKRIVVMK